MKNKIYSERFYITKPTHVTDYLHLHSQSKADQIAIIFEDKQLSWLELWQAVEPLSWLLSKKLGNQNQKIVGLLMTNSIDMAVAYLAVIQAGHIAMPIDPVYKKLEIDAIVKQHSPALVVIQHRYKDQISDSSIIVDYSELDKQTGSSSQTETLRLSTDEQIASLTFTSGTSGKPKSVPNTHANQIWSVKVCSDVWNWTSRDILLMNLPLSHWYGLVMGLTGAIYHGNTFYLRQQSFDAKAVLEELAGGDISLFTHTPLGYLKLLEQPGEYDLSKVRLFISGSAPLPPTLWQQFKDRFDVEILETYGSSETGRIAANTAGDIMLGSPGRILPSVDFKLSDDNEVLIKSGGVCPGYWQNQKATAQAMTKDGYWRTGDIGEIKNGHLVLKGRRQETVRKFGYTISPRDVEWALLENSKIKQAIVIGQQQPSQVNDRLVYFIVGDISESEVKEYSKTNLPFNWRADAVFILDTIPRNTSGKPKLAELKQMASEVVHA